MFIYKYIINKTYDGYFLYILNILNCVYFI